MRRWATLAAPGSCQSRWDRADMRAFTIPIAKRRLLASLISVGQSSDSTQRPALRYRREFLEVQSVSSRALVLGLPGVEEAPYARRVVHRREDADRALLGDASELRLEQPARRGGRGGEQHARGSWAREPPGERQLHERQH